jgi:hypothetical protein
MLSVSLTMWENFPLTTQTPITCRRRLLSAGLGQVHRRPLVGSVHPDRVPHGDAMTRSDRVRSRVVVLSLLIGFGASRVHAQTPSSDVSVPAVPVSIPTLTVNLQPFDAEAPVGVRLGLVAEVVGVPVVLEQASATPQFAVAQIRLRSTALVPIARVTLALTATRLAGGTPVRRTIPLAVSLAPGATQTVAVGSVPAADLAAVWLPSETGALEVAVIGTTALDGSTAVGDWGPPPFVPIDTALACGDATWQPTVAGETAADPLSGQMLECDLHGLWRVPVAEMVQ